MRLSVGIKIANSLSLTPQLQQAIRLLQLSSLELEQEVQLQLDSNPLLEKVEEQITLESLSTIESNNENHDLTNELNADHLPDDLPVDTDWDDVYTHQPTSLGAAEFEEREDNRQGHQSLQEYMLEQINLLNFSQVDKLIAYCMVDSLDDKGFLDAEFSEITASVRPFYSLLWGTEEEIEDDEVAVVLKHIQRLDPVGVGSRSLAECLLVQLNNLPTSTSCRNDAIKLLQHYELLITNELPKLIKQTGLNPEQLRCAVDLLKTFETAPGSGI